METMKADSDTVLFVDDEPMILRSIERLFMHSPHRVVTLDDAERALALVEQEQVAVVVSDQRMPKMQGIELLEKIKRISPPTVKVLLTGYADMQSSIDALRLGADDFLQKPCDIDELLYRISNCFTKQALQRKVQFYETILPICSYCKKIRNDNQGSPSKGLWFEFEEYLHQVGRVALSHGCCPTCYAHIKKELDNQLNQGSQAEDKPPFNQ